LLDRPYPKYEQVRSSKRTPLLTRYHWQYAPPAVRSLHTIPFPLPYNKNDIYESQPWLSHAVYFESSNHRVGISPSSLLDTVDPASSPIQKHCLPNTIPPRRQHLSSPRCRLLSPTDSLLFSTMLHWPEVTNDLQILPFIPQRCSAGLGRRDYRFGWRRFGWVLVRLMGRDRGVRERVQWRC
jgi:hypothetical protein